MFLVKSCFRPQFYILVLGMFFLSAHLLSISYMNFYFPFLFGLLFSLSCLDFYFPFFIWNLIFPFSIWIFFPFLCVLHFQLFFKQLSILFNRGLCSFFFLFQSIFLYPFLSICGLILDFFQNFSQNPTLRLEKVRKE